MGAGQGVEAERPDDTHYPQTVHSRGPGGDPKEATSSEWGGRRSEEPVCVTHPHLTVPLGRTLLHVLYSSHTQSCSHIVAEAFWELSVDSFPCVSRIGLPPY